MSTFTNFTKFLWNVKIARNRGFKRSSNGMLTSIHRNLYELLRVFLAIFTHKFQQLYLFRNLLLLFFTR